METSGCGGDWMSFTCDNVPQSNNAIPWTPWDGQPWPRETHSWAPVSGAGSWVPAGSRSPFPMVMQPCNNNVGVTGHVMVGWAVPVNIVQTASFPQQPVYAQPTLPPQRIWADQGELQVPVASHVHLECNRDVCPISQQYES